MSADDKLGASDLDQVREGLRLAHPPDPEQLAQEKAKLTELESAGFFTRSAYYMKLNGPGYLQSAMTLGGGTAFSCLFAGALFGYQLLWVAPVGMLLGVIVLSAVSHQTLSTGMRPFEAMRKYAGAPFAWGWALGALFSSIIWHFPQYSLAAASLSDMTKFAGYEVAPQWTSFVILAGAVAMSGMYGGSARLTRAYERILKYMVWGIVVCFGLVVLKTGISDWGALARGFFTFQIPGETGTAKGLTLVISGLAAAVGINMVFLYPYSLLARGWGREHRRLARFDLGLGMLVPYALAASLMVIAAANTIHVDEGYDGTKMNPVAFAQSIEFVVGPTLSRIVFNLGVMGMALSSITLQMLCAGFVCAELFGWEVGSKRYRLATLIPTPGVLAPLIWGKYLAWLAIPTTITCGLFLPIAYFGFVLLQRNRNYLKDDLPSGWRGKTWFSGMVFATLFMLAAFGYYLYDKFGHYLTDIFA